MRLAIKPGTFADQVGKERVLCIIKEKGGSTRPWTPSTHLGIPVEALAVYCDRRLEVHCCLLQ